MTARPGPLGAAREHITADDIVSRLTPFDHVFADLAAERFREIREEAHRARRDPTDRAQFVALPAVQHLLAEVESPDVIGADPAAAPEYATLLYVAYRFWDAGRPLLQLDETDLAGALAVEAPGTLPAVPAGACYVQLPERRVWARIAPDRAHEPLDGLFLVAGPGGREITVLAVLGLRPRRAGFSQVTVTVTPEELAAARREIRDPPFAPTLEGGEHPGFKSVLSTAELLYLAQLALAWAQR